MNQVDKVLKERGSKYGEFHNLAEYSQDIKAMYYDNQSSAVSPTLNEAMEMIIHKLCRIINGDPLYRDNLIDIQGYCQLYLNELDRLEKLNTTKKGYTLNTCNDCVYQWKSRTRSNCCINCGSVNITREDHSE